jgi:hypothetical protein
MEEANEMLSKTFAIMKRALGSLEQFQDTVERLDDDLVLSQQEFEDGEIMETAKIEETPIERMRRETFEAISRLAYNRSAAQAESFFDQLNWAALPMDRNREIQQFFGNPNLPYPDDQLSPLFQQESVQARVAAMREIIALVNGLHYHCRQMAQESTLKEPKTRSEAEADTLERLRTETVRDVAALSGLPQVRIYYLLGRLSTMNGDARRKMMREEFAEAEPERTFPRRQPIMNDGRDGQIITMTFKHEPDPFAPIPIPDHMLSDLHLPTNKEKIFRLIEHFVAEQSHFYVMAMARNRRVDQARAELQRLTAES